MDNIGYVFIFVFVAYIACQLMAHPKKKPPEKKEEPPPPPVEPDPDKGTQRQIAREILLGKKSAEDVKKEKNYDIDHIKQWVIDYATAAINYYDTLRANNCHVDSLENDIAWFKQTCRKFIGDDWQDKTGYHNREK